MASRSMDTRAIRNQRDRVGPAGDFAGVFSRGEVRFAMNRRRWMPRKPNAKRTNPPTFRP